ncbi:FecR domain-containing protein [Pseudanabaena sp. Chao 1811]|uniref:FecR domain-containing protein n=1 Tax=Pseudanabaena sp. Chao 1811 TaxID=2963092 RepID=UPI0022F39CCC|nr:FecR domain-containing protein [Pseudanabaena sp. Chao 1811]
MRLAIEKLGRSLQLIKPFLKLNYGEQPHMFLWNLLKSFSKTFGKDIPQAFYRTFPQGFPQGFWRLTFQPKRIAFFCAGLCIFALAMPQLAPVSAQSTQATVQEILDGNQVFIQNQQAYVNDVASASQQVRTGNSRTALLFNTGAVARLSANSVLRIGQCAQLSRGTILVNGAINACSSGITTGVRGTTYLLEVDESGNQQVKVLEGEVVVKRNPKPLFDDSDKPNTKPTDKPTTTTSPTSNQVQKPNVSVPNTVKNSPTPKPQATPSPVPNSSGNKPVDSKSQPAQASDEVVLKSGEKIEVAQTGDLGIIQKLTENEFVNLLQGNLFQGFTNQIPGINKVRDVFNGLFPNVNFPISIPGIPTPSIPIPSLPSFPF